MEKTPEELFEELTLQERISLLSGKSMWTLRDIERVGIPSIRVSDGPQGVRKAVTELTAIESYPATCFPTACAMACSWNRNLMETVGEALAKECREQEVHVLLGPGLNIRRHPFGGRNFEYFSEDPVVSGHMAASMVKGIQSSGHVGACIKHVCANNQESWRFRVNAIVDERTLREIYLKGFEYIVKSAEPWTMMCAYNQINGVYASENEWLFEKVVRKEWGYNGLVLTDWGATNRRANGIEAGIDLEMPGSFGIHDSLIKEALKDGRLSQVRFDEAVMRNLHLIHRSVNGMATGNDGGKYKIPENRDELYKQNHELAYHAALDCVVLLQNKDQFLPLTQKQQTTDGPDASDQTNQKVSIALIGDFARDPRYQGMGSSQVHSTMVDTVKDHISKYTDSFLFARGYCNVNDDDDDDFIHGNIDHVNSRQRLEDLKHRSERIAEAVEAAKRAEVVILMAGLPEIMESEGFDREHLNLPSHQITLIEEISKVNSNVVVVLSNGGPILMPWKNQVKAIVECYLLGQASARAILDILFGLATPSGKLTETFPLMFEDVPSHEYFPGNSHTVEYREALNVGYRYYDTAKIPVLFPFGHGLSYTSFSYSECDWTVAMAEAGGDEDSPILQVQCTVTNEGTRPGAEVVQLYVHHQSSSPEQSIYHPEQELKGFAKTDVLKPGESEQVVINLLASDFCYFDIGFSEWMLEEASRFELRLASSSRDVRWTGKIDTMDEIMKASGAKTRISKPSSEAQQSHPPLSDTNKLSHPLVVSDAAFEAMFDETPQEIMQRSTESLLGNEVKMRVTSTLSLRSWRAQSSSDGDEALEVPLLPEDITYIHRNSFLCEIENGYFGNMFARVVIKRMEKEMEDAGDKKQRKMIHAVGENLPLRCLATFSRGNLTFDVLDSLIAMFNGHYGLGISRLVTGAGKAVSGMFSFQNC